MQFETNMDDAAKAGGFDSGRVITMKSLQRGTAYKFRILEPAVPFHRVLYPCLVDDREKGGKRMSWRSVRLPFNYEAYGWKKEITIIDALGQIDLEIRKQLLAGTEKEAKNFFAPQRLWIMPVLDRQVPPPDDDKLPELKFLEVNWSVFDAIRRLQESRDHDEPANLRFGPHWVHDIVIKKEDKFKNRKDLPESHNTQYTVEPAKNNPFEGQLPASILEKKNVSYLRKLYNESVEHGIFTEQEKAAIDMFSAQAEILPLYKPMTNVEIMEQFSKAPLCLDAVRTDGPCFPNPQAMLAAMSDMDVAIGLLSGAPKGQAAIGSSSKAYSRPVVELPDTEAVVSNPEPEVVTEPQKSKPKPVVSMPEPVADSKPKVAAKPTVSKPNLGFIKDLSNEV